MNTVFPKVDVFTNRGSVISSHSKRIFLLGICFLFIAFCPGYSQNGISLTYAPSKILKHSERLLFDVPDRTDELRLSYVIQTSGKEHWERYWGKPRMMASILYFNFGNEEVLGQAFAVLPELNFTLTQWKGLRLDFQFGAGIAFLNRPYDAIENPNNNAIGSKLNNATSMKLGLTYQWNSRWSTSLTAGLVHFSNGLSSSPNKGINTYGIGINQSFFFLSNKSKKINEPLIGEEEIIPGYNKWILDFQYHYGITEHAVPGGPKYSVQSFSAGGGFRYTRYMTILFGGEYEYNDSRYVFFKRNFYTDQEARDLARSTIFYLGHEFRFNRMFKRLSLGFYLPYPIENSRSIYTKVVLGYYLPEIKQSLRPYIGIILKTHSTTAEYLGIATGISI